jgi:hypothetical protein
VGEEWGNGGGKYEEGWYEGVSVNFEGTLKELGVSGM